MSSQLSQQPVTPWQSPSPDHSPLQHNLPPTTWHVRKPAVAGDLQSTSTVTTPSPSSSSSSSPSSTSNQSPTTWHLHQYHNNPVTPPTTPPHQPQSVRTLPRCAVVNFRKDGDSLRWAPRVTQNSSGVAARVHNFEDAFLLEEFSSKALPGIWRSTGGNPRLSDVSKSNTHHSRIPFHSSRSVPPNSNDSPSPPPPPQRSSQPMGRRAKSAGQVERAFVRNSSVKKAVVLATEVHRPSFWSIISHTTKYQRSKAKARLQNDVKKRADNTTKRPQLPPSPDPRVVKAIPKEINDTADITMDADPFPVRQPWAKLSRRKLTKNSRGGKATKRAPERCDKKGGSLFQRLLSHLDKRNSKKSCFEDTRRGGFADKDRTLFMKGDGSSGSDCDEKAMYAEQSKGLFRQVGRHSCEAHSSRRVVSALTGNLASRRYSQQREVRRFGSHDDQYVTFITSES